MFPIDGGVDLSPPRLKGVDLLPPRVNPGVALAAGCDDGAAAAPRLNGLFAGVTAGVVLPMLNKDGLGVACGAASPPGMLGFAAEASLLPKPKAPAPLAGGCAGVVVFAPNRDVEEVAGFAAPPKREGAEVAGVAAFPNKLVPGGGPAGVVEGRAKVLLGAGVAAGVEEAVRC